VADIDVERKSGPPVWMWVLGLLLLALIIWAIVSMMDRDDTRDVLPATDTIGTMRDTVAPGAAGAAVLPAQAEAFIRDCRVDEGQRTDAMGVDHTFTVNCFNNLAASVDGMAQEHGATANVSQHTQTIRDRARQIEQSPPESLQHAGWTREAALAGASAMEALHQAGYTARTQVQAPVNQMRQHAQEIERTELHLDQMTHLRSYFRSAADALNAMGGRQQM
jgi:D-alanyl-D-alanine carboxypeptidase